MRALPPLKRGLDRQLHPQHRPAGQSFPVAARQA